MQTTKKLPSWEVALAPFDRSWLPLSENPDVHPQKNEPLNQEMHLKMLHFSSGLKMSGAEEKLLFTYLWNRYHQQIPRINLIQIGAITILLCRHSPLFHCWKDIWCWKLPCRVTTSENDLDSQDNILLGYFYFLYLHWSLTDNEKEITWGSSLKVLLKFPLDNGDVVLGW